MVSSPSVSRKQGIKQRGEKRRLFLHNVSAQTCLFFLAGASKPRPHRRPITVWRSCFLQIHAFGRKLDFFTRLYNVFSFLFSFFKSRDGDEGKKKSVAVLHYFFFPSLDNLTPTLRSKSSCLPVAASPPTIPPSSNLRCEFLPSQRRGKNHRKNGLCCDLLT